MRSASVNSKLFCFAQCLRANGKRSQYQNSAICFADNVFGPNKLHYCFAKAAISEYCRSPFSCSPIHKCLLEIHQA